MTRAEHAPWMDTIPAEVADAVRARWARGMADDALQRLALALTVPCARCGAGPGVECQRPDDGETNRETRFGFHPFPRGKAAGVQWDPLTEDERRDPTPPRPRRADGWPQVPPPGSDVEDDQGWRR